MVKRHACLCLTALVSCTLTLSLAGCFAKQSDLDKQEKELSAKIAKDRADLDRLISETRARLNQEIATLREEELPALRGSMDKGANRFETMQRRLDDVENKSVARLNVIEKIQHDQANLLKTDRDRTQEELAKLAETVGALAKTVDAKLTGHDKTLEQISRALTDLSARVDTDAKLTSDHLAEVNKSVTSVAKALRTVGEAIETREAEQDRRLDGMANALHGMAAQAGSVKEGKPAKDGKRASRPNGSAGAGQGKGTAPAPAAVEGPAADSEQKEYEQSLQAFKDGNYDGARKRFADFLQRHPDSKFAANAQYWLGECYYGVKDYAQAIEAFDRVSRSYPDSPKAPAALLKKGFAYSALNDRGRASSTLKHVVEAYPRSPEATKAKEKLAQLQ
ncbi:MAG: tol-pal system protein YbgF [Nitrospiraceae bacterium]